MLDEAMRSRRTSVLGEGPSAAEGYFGSPETGETAELNPVARVPRRSRERDAHGGKAISSSEVGHAFRNPPPPANANFKDCWIQQMATRFVSREMRFQAPGSEYNVLSLIADMSFNMGTTKWKTTYRFMRCGSKWTSGLGLSDQQIRNVLKRLERKEMILPIVRGQNGLTLAVNLAWRPQERREDLIFSETASAAHAMAAEMEARGMDTPLMDAGGPLNSARGAPSNGLGDNKKTPERKHQEGNTTSPTVRWRSRPGTRALCERDSIPEPERLGSPASAVASPAPQRPASGRGGLSTTLEPVERPVPVNAVALKPRQPEKPADALRSTATPSALMKTWQAAFEDTFVDIPNAVFTPPSMIDLGKLKSAVLEKWRGKTEDLHDVIEFTVRNWRGIMERQFGWMTKSPPPTLPSLTFFIQFRLQFIDIWTSRATDRWLDDLPANDRTRLIELTFKQGLSTEVALAKIGEEKALLRMRQENERIRQEALADKRTGLIALQQANRVPVYGVHNPHPQSYAAQKQAEAAAREAHPVKPGAIDEFLAFKCPEWDDNK